MKRTGATLFAIPALALAVTAARAQTCTFGQIDPVLFLGTGPAPGSTLQPNPDGSFTFTWCNANADYFLIMETVPGAHDIFFAFAGGVGPGAGVVSVTLGPGCAPTPPTGCIPSLGEAIFFTLDTLKGGSLLGSVQYTFTAPSQPPTNTPTATPTNTPTATSSNTPTATPTNTSTVTPTNTSTATPTDTPTGTLTNTPTSTPTPTRANTATATPTNTPGNAPTVTNTPAGAATSTPTPNPTAAQNVPTLSEWGRLSLLLLLAGLGYLSLRNR